MLTERQRLILNAIIDDYIRSAEPVGSRTISKRGDIGYSPATIRNDMSDLEELGYLEQPHTSAGRIPSHKGYRYYVDHLVQKGDERKRELDTTKAFFAEKIQQTEQLMQQAATILSGLTNYTAISLGPETFNHSLKQLQLVPLNDNTAVAIIVTNMGHVENTPVTIPANVPMNELEKFVNFLNQKLHGVPLVQLRTKLYSEISRELAAHISRYEDLVAMIDRVLDTPREDKLYLSGTTNMLNQPEFRDVEKIKTIFDMFDESEQLLQLFEDTSNGITVRIGAENQFEAFHLCSFITATYEVDGQSLGTIGILGPTRMDYAKVINLLDRLYHELAIILNKSNKS